MSIVDRYATEFFNYERGSDPALTRKLHACPIIGRVFEHLLRLTRAVIRRHVPLLGVFSNIYANPEISDVYVDASILRRFQRTMFLVQYFEKVLKRTLSV